MKSRRQYIRLPAVLPVEFYLADSSGKHVTPWLQGFTRDIGSGGIGLIANDLWEGFGTRITCAGMRVFLKIPLPFSRRETLIEAVVQWQAAHQLKYFVQYVVGLKFCAGSEAYAKQLFVGAILKRSMPFLVGSIGIGLALSAGFFFNAAHEAARQNRRLVARYTAASDAGSRLYELMREEKQSAERAAQQQHEQQERVRALTIDLDEWKQKYEQANAEYERIASSVSSDAQKHTDKGALTRLRHAALAQVQYMRKKTASLEKELAAAHRENRFYKDQERQRISALELAQNQARYRQEEAVSVSARVFDGMADWIRNRQDLHTGLVISYEGDSNVHQMCFTYDQALAVCVFGLQGDNKRAQRLLDFYAGRIRKKEPIYNAYFTTGEPAEYTVHAGPNAWIGIAALNYTIATGDRAYVPLARAIADRVLKFSDTEGGVRGGPRDQWYSTEHNLDAYAFFNLLYQVTGEKQWAQQAKKIHNWIAAYAYTQTGIPVKRGKGDATIATDTYAWSVAALGPEALQEVGMDAERILEYAIAHCRVETSFNRPQGQCQVRGFDFARVRHTARGGVVSSEWTAQMIVSFLIMADFYQDSNPEKAAQWKSLAQEYFSELGKMVIVSPSIAGRSEPCLPYASKPAADTGHGWRAPQGDSTGSLSATAFCLFAYQGYNPLQARDVRARIKKESN